MPSTWPYLVCDVFVDSGPRSKDRSHSWIQGEERQKELDKAQARSKSRKRSKSRRRSQSRGHEEEEESPGQYQMKRPGVWSS